VSIQTIYLLGPEILLVIAAAAVYLGGAFFSAGSRPVRSGMAGILAAALVLGLTRCEGVHCGPVAFDSLACAVRWLTLLFGGLLLPMAARGAPAGRAAEYVGSFLLALAGVMLAASADELVLLFLGLELVSIPTYVLLYLGHRGPSAREATAKYFFLSILASAVLLYGLSFLYGATGTTDLAGIRARLGQPGAEAVAIERLTRLAMVLIVAGLGFRITAVPFYFYAPDVYQGTSHCNAALLAILPKVAGMIALLRIVVGAMPNVVPDACRLLLILALITMTFGNVLALWQDNLRRLMAYSSIAHTGYMLLGLAAGLAAASSTAGWDGISAVLLYLAVYAAATLGTFAAFTYLGRDARPLEAVEELAGLGRSRALTAAAIGCFMFSLTGIPPLAGFWGKLAVFGSALGAETGGASSSLALWLTLGAVVGVVNAAISAGYYLRIVAVMYFRAPLGTPRAEGGAAAAWTMGLCACLVVLLGLYCAPLWQAANSAAGAAYRSSQSCDMLEGNRPTPRHLWNRSQNHLSRPGRPRDTEARIGSGTGS